MLTAREENTVINDHAEIIAVMMVIVWAMRSAILKANVKQMAMVEMVMMEFQSVHQQAVKMPKTTAGQSLIHAVIDSAVELVPKVKPVEQKSRIFAV